MVSNPPASAGDARDACSAPGLGRSPGVGKGNLLQYFCLGNTMDTGAWQATVHGVSELNIPEHALELNTVCICFKLLLSLRNMHFKFLHDSSSSVRLFLFRADNIALSGCTKVCISIHLWRTSWLLPHFGSYEWVNSIVVWQQTLYDLYYFKLVKLCFMAQNVFCFWWIFHVKLKTKYILLLLDEVVNQCQLYLDDWWHCWFQLYS